MPKKTRSEKTKVILYLWKKLTAEGRKPMVATLDDVAEAIRYSNKEFGTKLSDGNPANFAKDVVRGESASAMWPMELTERKVTGVQRPGGGRVLEFIEFAPGQTEPFPDNYRPNDATIRREVESLSLPSTSKALGRKDESWLIQVAVKLRLLEMHFATNSPLKFAEVVHLQTAVKLGRSEIDSLFLAQFADGTGQALIVCEAKQQGQRILEDQIGEQVASVAGSITSAGIDVRVIVPLGMKAIPPDSEVFVVEFSAIALVDALRPEEERPNLVQVSTSLFRLRPPVPGIGHRLPKVKKVRVLPQP